MQDRDVPASEDTAGTEDQGHERARRAIGDSSQTKIFLFFFFHYYRMAKKLVCPKCGHEWEYTGSLQKATCSGCQAKVDTRKQHEPKLS